jgi:NADH-quinone oxidoreductase subunit C
MIKEELKQYLEQTFPNAKVDETFDFPVLFLAKEELLPVMKQLRDAPETKFNFLFCETAIDRNPEFEMVYHLSSTYYHHDMMVKVVLEDRENPEIESVYSVWEAADLYEDEIYDLFGIRFTNHPNLRRIFLTEDWVGYPLRKDYQDDRIISL